MNSVTKTLTSVYIFSGLAVLERLTVRVYFNTY